MQRLNQPSWMVGIGGSMGLLTALYVRQSAGLQPRTDPVIPPLASDAPPVRPLPAERAAVVSEQWARWWARLLAAAAGRQPPRPPFPPTAADAPELADLPELRELVAERVGEEFPIWLSGRKADQQGVLTGPAATDQFETRFVADVTARLGRPPRPFRLSITVLPVRTAQGWRIAPEHLLITYPLLADRPAYKAFVGPVLAELA